MTPTTTLNASRQKQQQAHPSSPSPAETSSPCEDKDNDPSTSGVGASNEPIWIPSDVASDSEDDDGQDFDDSRSDATLPSINSFAAQSQPRHTIHAEAEEMSLGDESNGEDQFPRKRRRVSRSSASSLRDAAASVERPRRGRPSLRSRSTRSSQAMSDETEVRAVLARFEEWPLENASLKRITENGKTTFQLQFDWTPCTNGQASSTVRDRVDSPSTQTTGKTKRASAPKIKYTPQENDLLIKLKEGSEMITWPEIHRRFSETYPGRSVDSLQVHYSTKLKGRKRL
ncbi:hypothetical protein BGZ61DRAFT_540043 [Ilyonectria robusta]|uniref:uncharacterized protein n=1 Tax=Ilyonectria robusta TaxID=1079257 RepID=UPI001E8CC4D3|nr:uncharacterized protein BGZ61DRAFT_540043 [Ilyonectria robusta]KAH8659707.1 hypothetical protein BGZ61DRAFT_540043 [Ilyonectria robusta]